MELIESPYFYYRNNSFYCENVKVEDIISTSGTPVYIYSKSFFKERYLEFYNAFRNIDPLIFYAIKANFNLSVIKTFADLGSGGDVNSEGEYYRAIKAGIPPSRIILTGVGKTDNELKLGIQNDLLFIKAESEEEILEINKIAASLNKTIRVAIRVNPDVDAGTHPYISTGLMENKFGINTNDAYDLLNNLKHLKNIELTGIDIHIGSQINKIEPFVEAVEKITDLWFRVKEKGIKLTHFDIGGGMGVKYKDEVTFSIDKFAKKLIPLFKKLSCRIIFEPGRYLTANGGILATDILYTKRNNDKNFIITDAAMNDLLRPSIYNAYHHIQPISLKGSGNKNLSKSKKFENDIVADVVGAVCESGDFFAKGRVISNLKRGEKIAILSAGSYGMVMSSNYNGRRRPPEVLVDNDQFHTIRSRETFDNLMLDEENLLY